MILNQRLPFPPCVKSKLGSETTNNVDAHTSWHPRGGDAITGVVSPDTRFDLAMRQADRQGLISALHAIVAEICTIHNDDSILRCQ